MCNFFDYWICALENRITEIAQSSFNICREMQVSTKQYTLFFPNLSLLSALVSEESRGRALHLDTLLLLCSCRDSVHLPQGANYRAEIKHNQLFVQEFHPP